MNGATSRLSTEYFRLNPKTPMQHTVFRLFSLFLFFVSTASLNASILIVNSNADNGAGSLREAINLAAKGDTIQFSITGAIQLDSQIVLGQLIDIQGPGANNLAISGAMKTRIFEIAQGDSAYISGLTLQNGNVYSLEQPSGGAIANYGYLILRQCYLHHNEAGFGGAILNGFQGLTTVLELYDCTFAYNTALDAAGSPAGIPEAGGAIYIDGALGGSADVDAWNCTFAHNRADSTGGVVFLTGDNAVNQQTSFEANNCTFAYNEAELIGGIAFNRSPVIRTRNSIFALNEGASPHMEGSVQSFGFNLIDNSGAIFFVPNGQPDPNDLLDVEANIGVLGDNEGPIPTIPISCTSPAIDAANNNLAPTEDARGKARNGVADIGAYEFIPSDIAIFNLSADGPGSLPQAVLLACPGDTLRLQGLSGSLRLRRTLVIDKDLSILGNPMDDIYFRGGDSIRLLQVGEGAEVYLRWLNFYEGGPANFGGGAIQNNGNLTIEQSSFARNQARSGGAIANYGLSDTARLSLTNVTFSGNRAIFLDGGAIDNRVISAPASLRMTHCTFSLNEAISKGGAVYIDANTSAQSVNSLFSGNNAAEGPEIYGSMQSLGNNLIADDRELLLQTQNDLLNLSVALDPLALYGGPTTTHRLPIQAQAIDNGANISGLTEDQRGEPRVFNGTADIGAYEYNPATSLETNPLAFKLYPNPNKGTFVLEWSIGVPRSGSLHILNSQGQIIHEQSLENGQNQVHLSGYIPTGLYVARLQSGGQRYSQMFIVH
ncbi:MAG: choice-of-anchor Q domain-containing protein [Bacteroidota bacterium]